MLAASALIGCASKESTDVRGRGLTVATLPAAAQARVYEAAARSAFDITDPSLLLSLDARLLPRGVGLASGGRMADAVIGEVRRGGVFRGTCEPPLKGVVGAPRCSAPDPGYVIRYSPVFAMHGDTVQVYLYAQQFRTAKSGVVESLRFERAYEVVRKSGEWSAVGEATISKTVRGETK